MKLYNKKGISPLIATVLVIGFTIVLAGVVMQFIMPLFVQSGEKAKADAALMRTCSDLSTTLAIKGASVDTTTSVLNVIVDNPTATPIQYLIVKLYKNDGTAVTCSNGILGTDAKTDVDGAVPFITAGGIQTVKVINAEPSEGNECNAGVGTDFSKVEVTPAVYLKETKETKPCGSVTVSATVY